MKTGASDDVGLTASQGAAPHSRAAATAVVRAAAPTVAREVEELIGAIWREVLQVERLERDDNFFGRGGSSLLAVKVTARIFETLGIEVALREIFRQPTFVRFCEVIAERRLQAMEAALLASDEQGEALLSQVLRMSPAEVSDLNQSLKKER